MTERKCYTDHSRFFAIIISIMSEPKKNAIHEMFFNFADDLSKAKALELVSGHLQGSWLDLSEDDIDLNIIQAGFVNRIFVCHNKKSNEKVIIRLYGGKVTKTLTENILRNVGLEGEVLVFHLMDVNGIGPGLLGVFDGGRVERYLEGGHTLKVKDCADNETMGALARKLAKMHSLQIPFNKNPKDFIGIIRESFSKHLGPYNQMLKEKELPEGSSEEFKQAVKFSLTYDWNQLIDWFADTFPKIKTRTVFSHNDMNLANFMVLPDKSGDEKVTFLDFEFSGYSHRGCDIGHHFKNRTIDVNKFTEEGGNAFDTNIPYPTEEERRFFIREYLKVARETYNPVDESIDNEDHLLIETEFYGGLYQLFFTSFMLSTVEQFKHIEFPIHPGVMMAGFIRDYEERRKSVKHLLATFSKLSLNEVTN